jgi:hypothetical protein
MSDYVESNMGQSNTLQKTWFETQPFGRKSQQVGFKPSFPGVLRHTGERMAEVHRPYFL